MKKRDLVSDNVQTCKKEITQVIFNFQLPFLFEDFGWKVAPKGLKGWAESRILRARKGFLTMLSKVVTSITSTCPHSISLPGDGERLFTWFLFIFSLHSCACVAGMTLFELTSCWGMNQRIIVTAASGTKQTWAINSRQMGEMSKQKVYWCKETTGLSGCSMLVVFQLYCFPLII